MSSQILNHRTPSQILQEITTVFSALQPDVAINEASTLYMLMQVFAFTSAQNMDLATQFAEAAFITTAIGDDLTNLSTDRGVNRKLAEKANVLLLFERATSGSAITIPASSSFGTLVDESNQQLIFRTFDSVTIPATGVSVSVYAECQTAGVIGNVPADTVQNFITTVAGIDTVTNPSAGYGGVDEETDDSLRARVRDYLTNNTGRVTASGYRQLLVSLAGVKSATISPGDILPNYITAVVTTDATATGIPTVEQLAEWSAVINSDDNRAVCDVITLIAPTAVPITVTATINAYTESAEAATTIVRVQQAVIDYINGLDPATTVRVVDIANIIHDDAGVADFTLAAPVANVVLDTTEKATADSLTVTIS